MSIIYKNYLHSIKYLEKEEFYEDKKVLSQTFFFNNKKSKPMFGKKLLKCLKDISRFTKKGDRINLHKNANSKNIIW